MKARRNRRTSVLRLPKADADSEPPVIIREPKNSKHAVSLRIAAACAGYTLSEIAKRTGWEAETVRRYVRQGHRPSVDFVAAVAERFCVSVGWLVLGEGSMDLPRPAATPLPRRTSDQVDQLLKSLDEHINGLETQVEEMIKKAPRTRRGN